jgi:two-component system cell cycle response regulator
MSGAEALETVQRTKPDIVLLDVMMPGIDGIEVCRRLKSSAHTQHIPIVMVTALDQPEDRVKGLEAGADDFLTKPVNDLALFCRVKSLVRLKMLTDELRARSSSGVGRGLTALQVEADKGPGRVLVVDNRQPSAERIRAALEPRHEVSLMSYPAAALAHAAENDFELIIINLDLSNFDGLRICSQLKSLEKTRQVPILIIVDPNDHQRLLRAMDMGINDYLMRPIDRGELLARANTQVRRCRYTEQLRSKVQASIELAVTDPLTKLYNRRYMETQATALVEHSVNRGKTLSMLVLDVDHFKTVNDRHGHDVGDRVLRIGAADHDVALPAMDDPQARSLDRSVRIVRMRRLRAHVSDHNIYRWAGQLLSAVGKMVPEPLPRPAGVDVAQSDETDQQIARENFITAMRLAAG